MKSNILLFLILTATLACKESSQSLSRVEGLPYYEEATFTALWEKSDSLHRISDFSLFNQEGDTISQRSFQDKIYVADFFFTTCPGICPRMTANMKRLQDVFIEDDEIALLSHSVTPERDSVQVLKEYAKSKGAVSGKWHLVTGDREEIYRLGRKFYFVEEDLGIEKSDMEFLHTENFVLIDKEKHIRGIYNGLNKTSVEQLINDIKTLKKEG